MHRWIALSYVLFVIVPASADLVERRGSEPPVQGEITIIDDAGVTVRSDLGAYSAGPPVSRQVTCRFKPPPCSADTRRKC